MSYGMDSRIGMSFQASGGVASVASLHWLPVLNESLKLTIEQLEEQGMRGRYDSGPVRDGMRKVEGGLAMEAEPIELGMLLKSALGAPGSGAQVNSHYQHVFTPEQSDWDGLYAGQPATIVRYLGVGSADEFYDLVGNELTLKVSAGEFLTVELGFAGGRWAGLAAIAASYAGGQPWRWDQASAQIGGGLHSRLKELSLTIARNVEPGYTLAGSVWPSRIKRTGFRTIEVAGRMTFDTASEYQAFFDQSERELDVYWRGTGSDALRLQLPLARYADFAPQAGGPGEIEVGFSGRGVYSATSATALRITLINTMAGY